MKRITSIMAGSLLGIVLAGGAGEARLDAQDPSGEIFTVPFGFTADGHLIEPGTYEVRRAGGPFLISIENVDTGAKQLFSVRPDASQGIPGKGLLVFSRCGDQRQLSEFHIRGTSQFSATIEAGKKKNSDGERCSSSDRTTIAAR